LGNDDQSHFSIWRHTIKTLFVDMDGVLCDCDRPFNEWLKQNPESRFPQWEKDSMKTFFRSTAEENRKAGTVWR